jgi:diacylglycerol O-acyltransferase / wax synthase
LKAEQNASKTALVLGAAGGVGESVARLLCSQGWRVVGVCRTAAQGDTLLKRGACHHYVRMDLADAESIVRGFADLDELGIDRLDALVNCAAVTHAKPLEVEGMEELRKLFEVNLFSALRAVQLALPALRPARGRIVLVSSTSAAIGLPMIGAYSSSKFALEGLAEALRRELVPQHVAVSLVIPGLIRTPMTDKHNADANAEMDQLTSDVQQRYGELHRQHLQTIEANKRNAVTPERVAQDVLKALEAAKPKARYFCGVDQRVIRSAIHLLPDTVWDDVVPALMKMSESKNKTGTADRGSNEEDKMQQLNAMDALFIFSESSRTPMHVSPFFIYDVSTAPNGFVRFKDVVRVFERGVEQAPILRRKLVRVPLDLDEPYWADDPHFDVALHVRHVALPKPGDRRQLSILLANLASFPMDMGRPPWDAFVIEGLDHVDGIPGGSFGLLLRIHHSAIDGESGHVVLRALHDLSADGGGRAAAPTAPYHPVIAPTTPQMLKRAYFKLLSKPGKLIKLVGSAIPAKQRIKDLKARNPGEERLVPPTRFSTAVSANRVVSLLNFDMAPLRAARKVVDGATINDAVTAVVAGAMRRYLKAKGELPKESMTTLMPVNVRTESQKGQPGNMVSMALLNMHSDIEDVLERLRAIHDSAVYSKAYHNAVGATIMTDVAESMPAGITSLASRVATAAGMVDKMPGNTLISNVPGPQVPLFMAGAKVVEFHAIGALMDGVGLFHAANSYCGRIAITVLADHRVLPDPEFYEQCMRDSYAELVAATARSQAPAAQRTVKVAAAKAPAAVPKAAAKRAAVKPLTDKRKTPRAKAVVPAPAAARRRSRVAA